MTVLLLTVDCEMVYLIDNCRLMLLFCGGLSILIMMLYFIDFDENRCMITVDGNNKGGSGCSPRVNSLRSGDVYIVGLVQDCS